MDSKFQNRLIWVDYVRVIANFCVIFLHSAAPLLYQFKKIPDSYWIIGNIYDSAVRMCVPLFFMLSGYLLLEKQETFKSFFNKRFKRILIPLVAWSIFYILWRFYYQGDIKAISFSSLISLLVSPAAPHLWFLYALIGIYLYLPLLKLIVKYADNKLLSYYIGLWFLAVSVPPIAQRLNITNWIDVSSISGYSGYLVIGLILGKKTITKRYAIVATILALCSICITIVGTHLFTVYYGDFFDYFYKYLSPNIIIFSCSTFVLIKYYTSMSAFAKNEILLSIIRSLSSASLGMYLVHPVFLNLLENGNFGFFLSASYGNPIYSIPLTAIITFICSYLTILLIKKIVFMRIIIGE
ncbi:acyltransferase family protein [Nostoc sp. FACHB-152]|uniref:acyltransferase n=1 Tax=unclassified Nostoc TaxID=2593658 RepID=UPI001684FA7B|nr:MULTISPECIES: acyltransferase family protein [unclassified Nostoc]MBD2447965.1 acyltransferase family protein [Nostoc sp. FACHB-152]MBD2466072.1 acyltransferase family protein [Nostoc sp. FACHB-145]